MKLNLLKSSSFFLTLLFSAFFISLNAQVIEKFQYSAGSLNTKNGGTGWGGAWAVSKGVDVEAGDVGTVPGTPAGKVRFVDSDPLAFRNLGKTYTDEPGKIYWIEFTIQGAQKAPDFGRTGNNDSVGIDWSGISLYDGGNENGFMGKSDNFGVGFGDGFTISNALYTANHYLVKLVMSGDNNAETAYMWLNYTGNTEPADASANLTRTDFGAAGRPGQFNRIRLAGAGAWGTIPDIQIDNLAISESFNAAILPLKLISFNGVASSNGNTLTWVSSAEVNMKNFVVERMENDGKYQLLTTVSAHGNFDGAAYTAYDTKPLPGINYYRLKMVDIDGTFSYSPVIKIAAFRIGNSVSIYPNPAKNGRLTVDAGTETLKSVSIINISGMRVLNINAQPGINVVPVNVKSLARGIYEVEIVSTQSVVRKKLVIE